MKKLLASVLAASTVLSLSVASFATVGSPICDSDGDKIDAENGASISFDLESGGNFDVIHPDQDIYIYLGATNTTDTADLYKYVHGLDIPAQFFADDDYFNLSTKDKDGDASKLIKITQEPSKTIDYASGAVRSGWLVVHVGDTMTSDELKGTMTLEFKPQKDLYEAIYNYYDKSDGNVNNLCTALNGVLGTSLSDSSDKDDVIDAIDEFLDGCLLYTSGVPGAARDQPGTGAAPEDPLFKPPAYG